MNVNLLWSKLLDQIKSELTSLSYSTWFSDTELYKLDNNKAYIVVPMPIHKKHLMDNYSDLIINKLNDITGTTYDLVLLLKEEIEEEIKKQELIQEKNNDRYNNEVDNGMLIMTMLILTLIKNTYLIIL